MKIAKSEKVSEGWVQAFQKFPGDRGSDKEKFPRFFFLTEKRQYHSQLNLFYERFVLNTGIE